MCISSTTQEPNRSPTDGTPSLHPGLSRSQASRLRSAEHTLARDSLILETRMCHRAKLILVHRTLHNPLNHSSFRPLFCQANSCTAFENTGCSLQELTEPREKTTFLNTLTALCAALTLCPALHTVISEPGDTRHSVLSFHARPALYMPITSYHTLALHSGN